MKLLLTTLFFLTYHLAAGQKGNADIKMISEYGSNNPEVTNILQFQNIDYYRVKFVGKQLKGKYFTMYCKEIWDGEVTKVDTLINAKIKKRIGQIESDTLTLTVFGTTADDKLRLSFRFPMVGLNKKYNAIVSDDYSLRDIGTSMVIRKNIPFPAFAYILPYEEDGWKMYCAVAESGTDVEQWGKRFRIKHYLIFEIIFGD